MIEKAAKYAVVAHAGQRYGDEPYSYHLTQVADFARSRNRMSDMSTTIQMVAWLHDTLEDTAVTYKQLLEEFGLGVVMSVDILTKKEGQSYKDYMEGILKCAVAREVKTCDTMANLTNSIAENKEKNILKYSRQLHILMKGEYYE